MGTPTSKEENPYSQAETEQLADFVLMTQRSVILGLAKTLKEDNVSFSQFFLLAYLASTEYLTMTDIAKKVGHTTAAATELVAKMVKLGLVERIYSSEDRRKIMVRITSQGVDFVAKMREEIKSELQILLENLESEKSTTIGNTREALGALKSNT